MSCSGTSRRALKAIASPVKLTSVSFFALFLQNIDGSPAHGHRCPLVVVLIGTGGILVVFGRKIDGDSWLTW